MRILLSISLAMILSASAEARTRGAIPLKQWTVPSQTALAAHGAIRPHASLVTVQPCRVLDTRNADGPDGGPVLVGGVARLLDVSASPCGVPVAAAYSLNVTVTGSEPTETYHFLSIYPAGTPRPNTAVLNFKSGAQSSNAVLAAAGAGAVMLYASTTTHAVVDINGYFVESGAVTSVTAGAGISVTTTGSAAAISANFGGNGVANTVARSDHGHYRRRIIVSPVGTDAENGESLRAAVARIESARTDVAQGWTIQLEAGTYHLGATPLELPFNLNIEGAGRYATRVVRGGGTNVQDATLRIGAQNEISNLSIVSTGGAPYAVAVFGYQAHKLDWVDCVAQGGTVETIALRVLNGGKITNSSFEARTESPGAIARGIQSYHVDGSPTLLVRDSEMFVQGATAYGIWTQGILAQVRGTKVRAISETGVAYGTWGRVLIDTGSDISGEGSTGYGSTAERIRNARVYGTTAGLLVPSSWSARVTNSLLGGTASVENHGTLQAGSTEFSGPRSGAGTFQCLHSFDETFRALDSACN